jgi:outer membrane protein assembly factor BamB
VPEDDPVDRTRSLDRARRGPRSAGRSLTLPRWWAAILAGFLLVVVAVVVVAVRTTVAPCGDEVVSKPRSPLLSPARMAEQPDDRLDRLSAAVSAMGGPFGEVLGGVGYDYGQWLHLYGVDDGLVAFTKNNRAVTVLDPGTLAGRFAVLPATKRIAWDASDQDFLLLDLAADHDTRVSSYSLADGHRRWCSQVAQQHRAGQPVATAFLDQGDVVTALPDGAKIALTRLSGKDGSRLWAQSYAAMDRADYLGPLTGDLLVAGGSEEYRLADQPTTRGGPVITAVHSSDGKPAWSWDAEPGATAHVVGVDAGLVVVVERGPGGVRMFALSDEGTEPWSITPADAAYEATLRGDTVIMKSAGALYGYDALSGRLSWRTDVPTDRTFFPYGFTLAQMPSLDADHVLMPTTAGLVVLDVRDGSQEDHALPVDGISTTYWPYQLAVTQDAIGVVTNTGGVVARRMSAGSTAGG